MLYNNNVDMKKILEYIAKIRFGEKNLSSFLHSEVNREKLPLSSILLMFIFISLISLVLRFFVGSFAPAAKDAIKKLEDSKISQINKYTGVDYEFSYPAKFVIEELKAGIYPAGTVKITDSKMPNEDIKIIINQNIAKNSEFSLIKKVFADELNKTNIVIDIPEQVSPQLFNNITSLNGFRLKITFADGVKSYRFSDNLNLDNKDWIDIAESEIFIPWPYQYENGVYNFNLQTLNSNNLLSEVEKNIFIIDMEPPKVTNMNQLNLLGPTQLMLGLNFEVQDNFFNKENLQYRINDVEDFSNVEWQPFSKNIFLELNNLDTNKIFIQWKDAVENISIIYNYDLQKDLTAPKFYAEVSDYSDDLFRKIDIYGFDDLSDIEKIIISNKQDFSEQTEMLYASTILWNFDENRTAYIKLVDNFGNTTEPRIINAPTLRDFDRQKENKTVDTAKKLEIDQIEELNNQTQNFNDFIDDLTIVDNFQRKYLLNSKIVSYNSNPNAFNVVLRKESQEEIYHLTILKKDDVNLFLMFTEHDSNNTSDLEDFYLNLVDNLEVK